MRDTEPPPNTPQKGFFFESSYGKIITNGLLSFVNFIDLTSDINICFRLDSVLFSVLDSVLDSFQDQFKVWTSNSASFS